jgi:hypothetical protein
MMPCCFAEMIGGECEDSGKSGDKGKTTTQKQPTDAAQPAHNAKTNVAKPPVPKKPQEPPRRSSAGSSIASSAAPKAPKMPTDKSKPTVAQPSVSERQKDIPKTHTATEPSTPEKQQGTPKRPPVERSATLSAAPQSQKTSADKSKSTVGKPSMPKKSQNVPKRPEEKPTTPPYVAPSTEGNHDTEQPIDKDPTTENLKDSLAPPDMPHPSEEEHPFSKIVHRRIWTRIVTMPGKLEDLLTEQCIARIIDLCTNEGPMSEEELMNFPDTLIPNKIKQKMITMVNAPSYFGSIDGFERKSSEQRIGDIVRWYIKFGSIGMNFNLMGLDVMVSGTEVPNMKNFRNRKDFLTFNDLGAKFRLHHGGVNVKYFFERYNNKFWVFQKLSALSEDITPKVEFRFKEGKVTYPNGCNKNLKEAIRSLPDGKYVCKLASGMQGNGFHILEKTSQSEIVIKCGDGENITFDEFLTNIEQQKDCIIQDFICQHERIAKLHPDSLNTLRVVTIMPEENAVVWAAALKIGVGSSTVDNGYTGGLSIGIDLNTGRLMKYAVGFAPPVQTEHPDSNMEFKNFQIPYWGKIVNLVTYVHQEVFSGALTMGFDVAITSSGKIMIVESNPRWGASVFQSAIGGCGGTYLKYLNQATVYNQKMEQQIQRLPSEYIERITWARVSDNPVLEIKEIIKEAQ